MKKMKQASKLQIWIANHFEQWSIICGIEKRKISREEFIQLRNELKRNGFEDIILVLMTNHEYVIEEEINKFIKTMYKIRNDEIRRRDLET